MGKLNLFRLAIPGFLQVLAHGAHHLWRVGLDRVVDGLHRHTEVTTYLGQRFVVLIGRNHG
jgi:hypothetical protein